MLSMVDPTFLCDVLTADFIVIMIIIRIEMLSKSAGQHDMTGVKPEIPRGNVRLSDCQSLTINMSGEEVRISQCFKGR